MAQGFPDGTVVKNVLANAEDAGDSVQSLGQEDPLGEEMRTHSSIPAWKTPQTEEPGGLQSTRSQRVRHDWVNIYASCLGQPKKKPHQKC